MSNLLRPGAARGTLRDRTSRPHGRAPRRPAHLAPAVAALLVAALLAACASGATPSAPTPPEGGPIAEATVMAGAPPASAPASGTAGEIAGMPDAEPTVDPSAGADQSGGASNQAGPAAATATARIAALLPEFVASIGQPGSTDGQLMLPFDVDVDASGNLYVSDSTGVQKLDPEGRFLLRFDSETLPTALGGLAVSAEGTVFVTGLGPQVLAFDTEGNHIGSLGEEGAAPGQLAKPVDVALDAAGNVYVADSANGRVEKFDRDGRHLMTIGERGEMKGQMRSPRAVAVDGAGVVYVGEGDDYLIQRFSPSGEYLDTFGDAHADENVWRVGGIEVDEDGNVYVTQTMASRIQAYGAESGRGLAWEMGGLGSGPSQFQSPLGIAYDAGRLYVADQQNHRVQAFALRR